MLIAARAGVVLELLDADGDGRAPERLLAALRALPTPVIGRITQGAVLLDLRCLEDEAGFVAQLGGLKEG